MYFAPDTTETLVQLLERAPFTGCTTKGVLSGAPPLRLELYSDMLLALRYARQAIQCTRGQRRPRIGLI